MALRGNFRNLPSAWTAILPSGRQISPLAGEDAPVLAENAAAGGYLRVERDGVEEAGGQFGGNAPSFHFYAGAVVDGAGDGLVEHSGEDAAVHATRVALMDGLAGETGQDLG